MPSDWTAIDTLIRELGAVRSAADAAHAVAAAKMAIEQAIKEAAEAISGAIDGPQDPAVIARARRAVQVAADVTAALDQEMARSRRIQARSLELRGRAKELVETARRPD
jgi:hypothetical protein